LDGVNDMEELYSDTFRTIIVNYELALEHGNIHMESIDFWYSNHQLTEMNT